MIKVFCDKCEKEIERPRLAEITSSQQVCSECRQKEIEAIPDDGKKDVHTEHCCARCGCKYGDDDCPVVLRKKRQSRKCGTLELCEGFDWEQVANTMVGIEHDDQDNRELNMVWHRVR